MHLEDLGVKGGSLLLFLFPCHVVLFREESHMWQDAQFAHGLHVWTNTVSEWVSERGRTVWVFSSCPSSFVSLMLPHSFLFWLEHRYGDFQSRHGPSDALTLHYTELIPQRSVFLLTFNFLCGSMGAMASASSPTGFLFAVLLCSCNCRDNCNSRYINKDSLNLTAPLSL